MNYVRHLNIVLEHFSRDQRILPRHVSLYMALFQMWNKLKFMATMQISRQELMPLSKIGSINTYIRTIKELDTWGYVQYKPSKSMYQGSVVTIITFDNTGNNTTDNTSDKTSGIISDNTTDRTNDNTTDKTSGNTTDNTGDTPLINNYKTILNKENSNKPLQTNREHAQDEFDIDREARVKDPSKTRFQKPTLKEVESYFEEKKVEAIEAARFYNHFESNGWKVGGKSAMKDWRAAIRNWILNISRYASQSNESGANYLSTRNDKDYDEPL